MNEIQFSLEVDATRLEIRNALEGFMKILHEDNGFPMKDIIAEMLLYSSLVITDDDIDVNEGVNLSFSIADDEYDDEESNYELESAKDDLKYFKKDIKKLARDIEKEKVNRWELSGMSERMDELLEEHEEDVIEQFSSEVANLKGMLTPLLKEGEIVCSKSLLHEAADRLIHNISSIKSIVSDIDEASSALEEHGALEYCHEEMIRETKERCATYRAKKKMLDAEIAENSGNDAKAYKLKAEANALLMQDWKLIIKNNNYPEVDCLPC